jgi:MFS transporter, DHA1 family, multidrug resistance protein
LTNLFGFMRGNVLVLTISGTLGMFSRSMVFPYVPLYIMSLGGQPAEVGIVYAVGPLGGLLVFPVAGYLADHMNRARLIAFAGFATSLIVLINVFATSWEWIAVARFLWGFIVFHFPAQSAILADSLPPESRGRGLATMTTVSGSAGIIGPYVAGLTLEYYGVDFGMRILYSILAVAYFGSALINLWFIEETREEIDNDISVRNASQTLKNAYSGIPDMVRRFPRSMKALAVVIVLMFVANGVSGPFWVVYAKEVLGLTSSQWGLILLIESIVRSLTGIPAGFIVDRFGRTRFIIAGFLLGSIIIYAFGLVSGFVAVLAVRCLITLVSTVLSPACGALLADLIPRDIRGRAMAAIGRGQVRLGASSGGTGGPGMGFFITIPLMIASFCGGVLFEWDPMSPWVLVPGIMTIAAIIAIFYVRDPHQAEV